jgi:hypothetical protein
MKPEICSAVPGSVAYELQPSSYATNEFGPMATGYSQTPNRLSNGHETALQSAPSLQSAKDDVGPLLTGLAASPGLA